MTTRDQEAPRVCSPQMALSDENTFGGGVFHLKLLEALADAGTPCLIPLAFKLDHRKREGWDVQPIPVRRTYKLGPVVSNLVFFLALCRMWFFQGRRFDVLRVTDPYFVGPAALAFRRLARVTLAATVFHVEGRERLKNKVARFVCRRCAAVVVTSRFTRDQVIREFGIDPERVHVTHGGWTEFPAPDRSRADIKRSLGLYGKTLIGFIGTLSERKNPGYLLEVFRDLHARNSDRRLVFIGRDESWDDSMTRRLRERAERLGIGDAVVFAGGVDTAQKAAWLAAMDLFVFPSLLEGFGLAVVEAMAAGVPVAVSDRGSLPEIVEHGRTGLVLSLTDRGAFTRAVSDLLDDEEGLAAMGRAARECVREVFTWERCARETDAIHRRAVAAERATRLGVILNAGDSLATMEREGQRDRFAAYYVPMWESVFDDVRVLGYGGDDTRLSDRTGFVPGRPDWRGPLYGMAMPLIRGGVFRGCRALRVMQAGAAWPLLLWRGGGRRLVVTYGYEYGEFMRRKGRPVYAWFADELSRLAVRRADAVICTTGALEARVRSWVGPGKTLLVPNGVDLDTFRPAETRKRTAPTSILFVGRLSMQKNLDVLIDALSGLVGCWSLTLVGDGPLRGELEARCREAGVSALFTGTIPHSGLPEVYRAADVFVLPSVVEGHPKALVEAMACGLACVGADVEGVRDVIIPGENGLLVAPGAEALREALARLIADADERSRLGAAARAHAERHYDIRATLDAEARLWRRLLNGETDS